MLLDFIFFNFLQIHRRLFTFHKNKNPYSFTSNSFNAAFNPSKVMSVLRKKLLQFVMYNVDLHVNQAATALFISQINIFTHYILSKWWMMSPIYQIMSNLNSERTHFRRKKIWYTFTDNNLMNHHEKKKKKNFHNLSERITSSSTLNLKETPEAYVTHYTSPSDSQDHHTWKQGEHTALLFFLILCRTFTLSKHFCCLIITHILF